MKTMPQLFHKRRLVSVTIVTSTCLLQYVTDAFVVPPLSALRSQASSRLWVLPEDTPTTYHNNSHDETNKKSNNPTTNQTVPSQYPTITRLYTGADGQSHFADMPMDFQAFTDVEGAHGWAASATVNGTTTTTGSLIFRISPANYALDWHTAPRRQYILQLRGQVQIKRTLGPGDVLLAEDLTGQGHCTRVVGNETRFYAVVPVIVAAHEEEDGDEEAEEQT